jgi:uncharacterized membrane protein YozB (DUF420 family)
VDEAGFLFPGSTRGGDLNLLAQIALGLVLLAGMGLARRGRYRAHGVCQTVALLLTLALTVAWMVPQLRDVYGAGLTRGIVNRVNVAVAAHAALGTVVLVLGAYVVLVAGTRVVPARARFENYRPWMRTLLALWWAAILLGMITYWLATH